MAAGAILAVISDTVPLEAFGTLHDDAGPMTMAGFLATCAPSKPRG